MSAAEWETVEGVVVAVRGPFEAGRREIDLRLADGRIETALLSAGQFLALAGEAPEARDLN